MAVLGGLEVTADDVAEGWRSLTVDQITAAETILGRAAAILPSQSPGLLDRLAASTIPPEAVEQVLIQAVRRALLPSMVNPDGAVRVSERLDDFTESREWDAAQLAAGLHFTPRELGTLAGRANRRRAFTINTMPSGR